MDNQEITDTGALALDPNPTLVNNKSIEEKYQITLEEKLEEKLVEDNVEKTMLIYDQQNLSHIPENYPIEMPSSHPTEKDLRNSDEKTKRSFLNFIGLSMISSALTVVAIKDPEYVWTIGIGTPIFLTGLGKYLQQKFKHNELEKEIKKRDSRSEDIRSTDITKENTSLPSQDSERTEITPLADVVRLNAMSDSKKSIFRC